MGGWAKIGAKTAKTAKKGSDQQKFRPFQTTFSDQEKNFPQALTKFPRYDRMKKPAGVAPGRSSLIIFYLKGRRNQCKQKNDYENENEKFFHFSVLLVRVKLL